jgi:alpha-L-arabinofuranosidase
MLKIDPTPRFPLSPYLYMQFMEPLGTHDPALEAGWDFMRRRWKEHFIAACRELAPTLMRWGGIFTDFYRWKEGVGPCRRRKSMLNLCWGGTYTNQIGTHEWADFCRQVGSELLIGVNFESDGREHYHRDPRGSVRTAGPAEAAAWVDYCNNPGNKARKADGAEGPFNVKLWQLGNETSYSKAGYDCATSVRRTRAFIKAMRKADPDIVFVGWGDSGWAKPMLEAAGGDIKYLAFHPHFDSGLPDSPLKGTEYRKDPERTWQHLMHAWKLTADKIAAMRQEIAGYDVGLAITESHFYLYPHNTCQVLRSWAAGVADARVLNVHERNGDVVKMATLADFCGNRWTVNAVMIAGQLSYLMPVGRVMSLYRRHVGKQEVGLADVPADLDVTASRTGDTIFLHVVNVNRTEAVRVELAVEGMKIAGGKVFQIADDPRREIDETCADLFKPVELALPAGGEWTFPAASVSAVELEVKDSPPGKLDRP